MTEKTHKPIHITGVDYLTTCYCVLMLILEMILKIFNSSELEPSTSIEEIRSHSYNSGLQFERLGVFSLRVSFLLP